MKDAIDTKGCAMKEGEQVQEERVFDKAEGTGNHIRSQTAGAELQDHTQKEAQRCCYWLIEGAQSGSQRNHQVWNIWASEQRLSLRYIRTRRCVCHPVSSS
jgi:hypothetical protein